MTFRALVRHLTTARGAAVLVCGGGGGVQDRQFLIKQLVAAKKEAARVKQVLEQYRGEVRKRESARVDCKR